MTFLLVFSRSGDTLANADMASLGRLRGVGAKCAQAVMSLQTHEAHLHLDASITGPLKIGFPCKRPSPVAGQRASNLSLPLVALSGPGLHGRQRPIIDLMRT
jgi:hypothetical protein